MAAKASGKPAKPRSGRTLAAIEKVDIAIARTVALDEAGLPGRLVGKFAELGDQPPMRILCGATIAAGIVGGDGRLARTGLRMALAHSVATAIKSFVKDSVDRTRPGSALDTKQYKMTPGNSRAHRLQSMPSGHSAGVVAVAGAAMADYEIAAPASVAGASVLAAQLPSRNHFLTDVLAGGAIGLVAVAIARALLPPDPERPD